MMVKQWNDYFKPSSVLDLGCGRGPYLYFWKWFVSAYKGIELSEYAVKNAFVDNIINGNITNESLYLDTDLITAIDVLEHLTDEDLMNTLSNMSKHAKRFSFFIPFVRHPNLQLDK